MYWTLVFSLQTLVNDLVTAAGPERSLLHFRLLVAQPIFMRIAFQLVLSSSAYQNLLGPTSQVVCRLPFAYAGCARCLFTAGLLLDCPRLLISRCTFRRPTRGFTHDIVWLKSFMPLGSWLWSVVLVGAYLDGVSSQFMDADCWAL